MSLSEPLQKPSTMETEELLRSYPIGGGVSMVASESHAGGPLALVREGDQVELDVPNRHLEPRVDEREQSRRRDAWRRPHSPYDRGYGAIFARHATQAYEGCDFDFLTEGPPVPEPELH